MAYSIVARDIQKLYGFSFSALGHRFEIQPKSIFPARGGLEAYGLRVRHEHPKRGDIHAFLVSVRRDIELIESVVIQ